MDYIDFSQVHFWQIRSSFKIDLSLSGYNDAFLVAFQNGKNYFKRSRIWSEWKLQKENLKFLKSLENPIDPEMVRFRVQVGAFKEKVPDDILASFKN